MADYIEVEDILTIRGPGFLIEIKEPWNIEQFAGTKRVEKEHGQLVTEYTKEKCMFISYNCSLALHAKISNFIKSLMEQ